VYTTTRVRRRFIGFQLDVSLHSVVVVIITVVLNTSPGVSGKRPLPSAIIILSVRPPSRRAARETRDRRRKTAKPDFDYGRHFVSKSLLFRPCLRFGVRDAVRFIFDFVSCKLVISMVACLKSNTIGRSAD